MSGTPDTTSQLSVLDGDAQLEQSTLEGINSQQLPSLVERIKSCFGCKTITSEEGISLRNQHTISRSSAWADPGIRQWFLGLYDESSPLHILMRFTDILQIIVELTQCIVIGDDHDIDKIGVIVVFNNAQFPAKSDAPIDINMMPINLRDLDTTLPPELKVYAKMLYWVFRSTYTVSIVENGTVSLSPIGVSYITVQEGWVEPGDTQRRSGLHTDAPGNHSYKKIGELKCVKYENMWWGGCKGGIFFANNIDESCRVWNCKIRRVQSGYDAVGEFGDCEHLRPLLSSERTKTNEFGKIDPGAYEDIPGNKWYWMTDRTPHECLPVKKRCWRQFIRVVVGDISVWYKTHSTPNPNCAVPKNVTILEGNKFKGNLKVVQQGDFVYSS